MLKPVGIALVALCPLLLKPVKKFEKISKNLLEPPSRSLLINNTFGTRLDLNLRQCIWGGGYLGHDRNHVLNGFLISEGGCFLRGLFRVIGRVFNDRLRVTSFSPENRLEQFLRELSKKYSICQLVKIRSSITVRGNRLIGLRCFSKWSDFDGESSADDVHFWRKLVN